MPEIANPQLKDHCNNALRPLANLLSQAESLSELAIAEYNARNLGTVIDTAGAENLIDDGSASDGRTRVVGGDVYNLQTLLADLQTFMTSGRRDVIAKWRTR